MRRQSSDVDRLSSVQSLLHVATSVQHSHRFRWTASQARIADASQLEVLVRPMTVVPVFFRLAVAGAPPPAAMASSKHKSGPQNAAPIRSTF